MLKKLIFTMIFVLSLCTSAVYADGFCAYASENKIKLIEADINDGFALLAVYLEDNSLCSVHTLDFADKKAKTDIEYSDENVFFRLYYSIGTDLYYSFSKYEIKILNEKKEEFVPVYGNTAAAVGAVAVVKSVENEWLEETSEAVMNITAFYRGNEINIAFEEGYAFKNPLGTGTVDISELKEGDIIRIKANLSGQAIGAELLFTAPKSDAVTANDESKKLYIRANEENGSYFGLVSERDGQNIVLYNLSGKENEALYLCLEPNTVVYTYDNSKRNDKLEIGSIYDIYRSEIHSTDKDDNDNIVIWKPERNYNYAYVRIYDGIVCDVVFYKNY